MKNPETVRDRLNVGYYRPQYHGVEYPLQGDPARDYKKTSFRQKERELIEQFKQDLFDDLGVENTAVRLELWEYAWDAGHSSGLYAVLEAASEMEARFRVVFEAGRRFGVSGNNPY